jgi:hypothetical protein
MLARQVLIGVMALGSLPVSPTQSARAATRVLLAPAPLSDEITALTVTARPEFTDSPANIEVLLQGQSIHPGEVDPKPLTGMTLQVWLLRTDGTTLAQVRKPINVRGFAPGLSTAEILFAFPSVPPQELAGVVMSVNGKLYVREIKVNPAS